MQDVEPSTLKHQNEMTLFYKFADGKISLRLLETDGTNFIHPSVQLNFKAFTAGQVKVIGQQIYARIRESSKYYYQVNSCINHPCGYPFPVLFEPGTRDFIVKGGVGGQYRLEDVELYVIIDGQYQQLT